MKRLLVSAFLLSSFAFPAFSDDGSSEPEMKITKIEDSENTQSEASAMNQFSVVCLINRTDVTMTFQWRDSSSHNTSLAPGYQQSFSWNDTKPHHIVVQYDSDLSDRVAWKTYRLDAASAAFPDCSFGKKYQFSKVQSRWVDIYTAIAP